MAYDINSEEENNRKMFGMEAIDYGKTDEVEKSLLLAR